MLASIGNGQVIPPLALLGQGRSGTLPKFTPQGRADLTSSLVPSLYPQAGKGWGGVW